jgi:hypothetical protein
LSYDAIDDIYRQSQYAKEALMPRISTAGFSFGRDAFTRSVEKLEEGQPRSFDAAGLEDAIRQVRDLIDEKGYSEQDVVDVLAAELDGTATAADLTKLQAIVRRALKAERKAPRTASGASRPRRKPATGEAAPKVSSKGSSSHERTGHEERPGKDLSQSDREAGPSISASSTTGGAARPGGAGASETTTGSETPPAPRFGPSAASQLVQSRMLGHSGGEANRPSGQAGARSETGAQLAAASSPGSLCN